MRLQLAAGTILVCALVSCGHGDGGTQTVPSVLASATPATSTTARTTDAVTATGPRVVQSALAAPDSHTSSSVTVTLPAAPAAGDVLVFGVWSAALKPTYTASPRLTFAGGAAYGAGQGAPAVYYTVAKSGDPATWTFTTTIPAAMAVGAFDVAGATPANPPGRAILASHTNVTGGWDAGNQVAATAGELPLAMYFSSYGNTTWTLAPVGAAIPVLDQSVATETNLSAALMHASGTTGAASAQWWGSGTASQAASGAQIAALVLPPGSTATPQPTATPVPTPTATPTPPPVVDATTSPLPLDENPKTVYGDTAQFGAITGAASEASTSGETCATSGTIKTHYHAHLTLYVNGHQYAVPAGTGIVNPAVYVAPYFVNASPQGAACYFETHVHALEGVLHVEMLSANGSRTLGQFLDVWGQQLSLGGFGPLRGPTRWFDTDEKNGTAGTHVVTEHTGDDPHFVTLQDHHEYTIEVGPAWLPIPNYSFGGIVP